MDIAILSDIDAAETIAVGHAIREGERLRRVYGPGRWRERKGVVRVPLPDGSTPRAEVRGYEAHGLGRKEFKGKRLLEETP